MKPEDVKLREVLFEFRQNGRAVRVSAIDPYRNVEAVVVGAPQYSRAHMKRLAERKLRFIIAKKLTAEGF